MNTSRHAPALLASIVALSIAACGGGSTTQEQTLVTPQPTTGKVVLLLTDRASDDFSEINLNVLEARLIGGDTADGQQVLFHGIEPINLLDLENFSEPVVFGEVKAGIYTKLRLIIDQLELVPADGGPAQYPPLPANGKIDLLDPQGIEVLPGRTLIAEIDMEANKAIHIVGAGHSGRYQFRPVVKARFMDGDAGNLPDRLARLVGTASMIDPSGDFRLCDIETPDSCVNVSTGDDTSIFDGDGLATGFSSLVDGDQVAVIGSYSVDSGILLNAIILEIGGNAEQMQGEVVSNPADDQFLLLRSGGEDIVVELQADTRYYGADGALDASAITLGAQVEVEGVQPPKADPADPDLVRAALVFVEPAADEQLSGTISAAPDATTRQFTLTTEMAEDHCVAVADDASILLVDTMNSAVTMGEFDALAANQVVDVFGSTVDAECAFSANEVIVDVNASPSP